MDALILPPSAPTKPALMEQSFQASDIGLPTRKFCNPSETRRSIYRHSQTVLKNCARKRIRKLVELFERDDVAIYNSIPTAEGAMMMAIENTDITIHSSRAIVLGLGGPV